MADNIQLNAGSGGDVLRAIDINSVKYQVMLDGYYLHEILKGNITNTELRRIIGRNDDVDAAEDIVAAGGNYTGFILSANDEVEALGGANDTGSEISSGTATGGSATTLVDSGADFVITDGVAPGDLVINTSKGCHAIITTAAATQLDFLSLQDGVNPFNTFTFEASDTYVVVNATSTGAAAIKILDILDQDYAAQSDVYLTLNGATPVVTSGVNAIRAGRAIVVHAGSGGSNAAAITVRDDADTATYCTIPIGLNRNLDAIATIPAGKIGLLLNRSVRTSGAAAVSIRTREYGSVFVTRTSLIPDFSRPGDNPILIPPYGDLIIRADSVAAADTVISAEADLIITDIP